MARAYLILCLRTCVRGGRRVKAAFDDMCEERARVSEAAALYWAAIPAERTCRPLCTHLGRLATKPIVLTVLVLATMALVVALAPPSPPPPIIPPEQLDVDACIESLVREPQWCGRVVGDAICFRWYPEDHPKALVRPRIEPPIALTVRSEGELAPCTNAVRQSQPRYRAHHVDVSAVGRPLFSEDSRRVVTMSGERALCVQLLIDVQREPAKWGCTKADVSRV